jgi:hypothetical protein
MPYTEHTKFDPKAAAPNSYVFDVERVSGGKLHTYCFHGTVSDDFSVNLVNQTAALGTNEQHYLRRCLQGDAFKYGGEAPPVLEATWRLRRGTETIEARDREGQSVQLKQDNAEATMLGGSYDESGPRKFTRLHLAGHGGERVLVAHIAPNVVNEQTTWPFLFVQRRGENLESVWPAIIEPYAGESFITQVRPLDIAGNEADAQRAIAVEVVTKTGRKDLCFRDGRIKRREVGSFGITGRFAYVSGDEMGLRLAHRVEGTGLSTPWGMLTIEQSWHSGKVVRVDYSKRKVWLDGDWADAKPVGQQIEFGNANHKTSFVVVAASKERGLTMLTLDKAMDLSYAHVIEVSPEERKVVPNIGPVEIERGMDDGLTCTTDDRKKSCRCKVLEGDSAGYVYQLDGNVSEQDFLIGSIFRVWEFGVGDSARLASSAVVR